MPDMLLMEALEKMDKTIDGKTYFLNQVVDDNGNPLLNPATTSILVYDNAVVENIGGEEVIAYNFHEYALHVRRSETLS